jgi:multiple sugar transport system permease protein
MKAKGLRDREEFLAPALLMPVIIYIVLLVGFPFIMSFLFSLSNVTVGNPQFKIVGFHNFARILGHILAELLRQQFRFKWLVRFLILLPWTTPIALGTIGFLWFYDSLYSPIDWLLRTLGLLGSRGDLLGANSNLYWLGRPYLAMFAVIVVHVWRLLPLAAIILLAGMNSIPKEIIEAAEMDGAGYFRRLFGILLPLLFPVIGITVLFGTFFTFTNMDVVWILTRGGPPPNSTQVLATLAFLDGIEGGDLAQGAAVAIFFFPVLAGIAAIVLRLVKKAVVV